MNTTPRTPDVQHAIERLTALSNAIVETVNELGWAPSGVVYAALMGQINYEGYVLLVDVLVKSGKLNLSNNILTPGGGR